MEELFEKLEDYKFPKLLHPPDKGLRALHRLLNHAHANISKITYEIYKNQPCPKTGKEIGNKYFPEKIKKLIEDDSNSTVRVVFKTPKREITLRFVFMRNANYENFSLSKCIYYLRFWFSFLDIVTEHTQINQSLDIIIFLTKERKRMPKDDSIILDANHVNSALTYICQKHGSILIFREEEWFKVLIHECMHSYCLDFSSQPQEFLDMCIRSKLSISVDDPHYSETYAETWAEILNIGLLSYDGVDWHSFSLMFDFYLQLEVFHSFSIASNILSREGMSFESLREKKHLRFKTHVYEYHVLKTILMFSCSKFLTWCLKHNGSNMLQITTSNIMGFCELIVASYESKDFQKFIKDAEKKRNVIDPDVLRMSICEI